MEAASQHKLITLLFVLDRQVGLGWIIPLSLLQLKEHLRC